MTLLLGIAAAVLALLLTAAVTRISRDRAKYRQSGLVVRWPIPKVDPAELDAAFSPTPLGPSRSTEVRFVSGLGVPGGVNDLETWILCVLAQKARRIFEFGTCTGKTTYLLALNAPEDARVTTLTLAPAQMAAYASESGDDRRDRHAALKESVYESFYYTGTAVEPRIVQLFGDSKAFDESAFASSCDLIFIDGSHAASYVQSDTAKALSMLRPGGVVLWHDYRGPWRARGVFKTLNALLTSLPVRHIAGTSLVYFRKPAEPAPASSAASRPSRAPATAQTT